MTTPQHSVARRGFTMVELLVVVAILLVLAALVFVISKKAIDSANSIGDTATMRDIYNTIPLYAADHNDLLPGPINTGVKATYGPASTGRLSFYIAEYLGYTNPQRDEFLEAMAYSWQRTAATKDAPCAYIRENTPTTDGITTIRAFGHPLRSGVDRLPKSMSLVFGKIDPVTTWCISDLDQKHPDVGSAGWKNDVPAEMSHGKYRIAIFFDGHAGKLDVDNNPQ